MSRSSPVKYFKNLFTRLFRRQPKHPDDPYAEILVPVRRGPKGRSGAAVAEPDEHS